MTLAFGSSIASPVYDVCVRPSIPEFVIIDSSGSLFRYAIPALTLTATITGVGANYINHCMITADKVVAMSTSSAVPKFIDLIAATVTAGSGSAEGSRFSTGRGQQMAGATALGKAIGLDPITGHVHKFDSGTNSVTVLTPSWLSLSNLTCVISKPGTNNFIVGTDHGDIFELDGSDTNFSPVAAYGLTQPKLLKLPPRVSCKFDRVALQLAYVEGNLLVLTNLGELMVIDHATGTEIQQAIVPQSQSSYGYGAIMATDGITALVMQGQPNNQGGGGAQPQLMVEFDWFKTPMEIKSILQFNTGTPFTSTAGAMNGGKAIFCCGTAARTLSYSGARATSNLTPSTNDGGGVDAELIILDVSGGINSAVMMGHNFIPAAGGKNIPVTTGVSTLRMARRLQNTAERFTIRRT